MSAVFEYFSQGFETGNADGASCLNMVIKLDFGNAPSDGTLFKTPNYKTKITQNGPRHLIDPLICLGEVNYEEIDGMDALSPLDNDCIFNPPLNSFFSFSCKLLLFIFSPFTFFKIGNI